MSDKDEQIRNLSQKVQTQGEKIQELQDLITERNRIIGLLGMVWCSGGCPYGMRIEIDDADIEFLQDNLDRMKAYKKNRDYREAQGKPKLAYEINLQMRGVKGSDVSDALSDVIAERLKQVMKDKGLS